MIKYLVGIASGGRGMNDDEKMFQIGVWSICVVLFYLSPENQVAMYEHRTR